MNEYFLTKQLDLPKRYGKGSYVLITGGANGIGLEYAKQLSKLGFNFILIDLDQKGLDKAKEEILDINCKTEILTIEADLTDLKTAEEYEELVEPAFEKDVSILINNVGAASLLPFEEASSKIISDTLLLNANSVATFSSIFHNRLASRAKENKAIKSAIINMASSSSFFPVKAFFIYSMTKAFVSFFSQTLTLENTKGVDVFNVCPGFVSTYMTGFRKDNQTITPQECVTSILRSLGTFRSTETSWKVRLIGGLGLQNLWYICPCLVNQVSMFLGNSEESLKVSVI